MTQIDFRTFQDLNRFQKLSNAKYNIHHYQKTLRSDSILLEFYSTGEATEAGYTVL
jgi:hypothetical protein